MRRNCLLYEDWAKKIHYQWVCERYGTHISGSCLQHSNLLRRGRQFRRQSIYHRRQCWGICWRSRFAPTTWPTRSPPRRLAPCTSTRPCCQKSRKHRALERRISGSQLEAKSIVFKCNCARFRNGTCSDVNFFAKDTSYGIRHFASVYCRMNIVVVPLASEGWKK